MLSSHECSLTRNLMGHEKKGKNIYFCFFLENCESQQQQNWTEKRVKQYCNMTTSLLIAPDK